MSIMKKPPLRNRKEIKIFAKKFEKIVNEGSEFLIITHPNPDCDAVGSSLALWYFLNEKKKKAKIVLPNQPIVNANFLPNYYKAVKIMLLKNGSFFKFDKCFLLDLGDLKRLNFKTRLKLTNCVNIDHHFDNQIKAKLNFVDSSYFGVSEILLDLFLFLNLNLNKTLATCLLFGIFGDTEYFQSPKMDSLIFQKISYLLTKNADLSSIILNVLRSYNISQFKLWAKALKNFQIDKQRKFAWTKISLKQIKSSKAKQSDRQPLANNFARAVRETKFGFVAAEEKPNSWKISIRSREPNCDVQKIAAKLGGGGHQTSASFKLNGKYNQILKKIFSVISKHSSV